MASIKEIKEIKAGLQSSEDILVTKALAKVSTKGDSSLLSDLINLWVDTDNPSTKKEVESILYGLKEKEALTTLIAYIDTAVSDERKWLALNAIWQSGFDASEHLSILLDFAINNSYTNAIDVMTIIDNSDFLEKEDDLIENNLRRLNDYLLKNKSDNLQVLLEIKSILIDKRIAG